MQRANLFKDADIAKTSLSSLKLPGFITPAREKMRKHVGRPESSRARSLSVIETTDLPISSPESFTGLFPGPFGSYVGDDKGSNNIFVTNQTLI